MFEDFEGEPGNRGYFQMEEAKLHDLIFRAHRSGWQVATHAIGDRAVSSVLDAYAEAQRLVPRDDPRHRIEHCGMCRADDVARIAELGVIPVPQARFISEIGDGMARAVGDRRPDCYRQRSFLDAGVVVPGSSDRPVVNGAPLLGVHDLVNQRTGDGHPFNPHEALTPEEALRAYTCRRPTPRSTRPTRARSRWASWPTWWCSIETPPPSTPPPSPRPRYWPRWSAARSSSTTSASPVER